MRFVPDRLISEGEFVAAEAHSYAELNNGRNYRNRYELLFEIADGKIRSVREYMDTKHAYQTFIAP
jgi:ketosteroid isomerase-like protein